MASRSHRVPSADQQPSKTLLAYPQASNFQWLLSSSLIPSAILPARYCPYTSKNHLIIGEPGFNVLNAPSPTRAHAVLEPKSEPTIPPPPILCSLSCLAQRIYQRATCGFSSMHSFQEKDRHCLATVESTLQGTFLCFNRLRQDL